MIISPGRGYVFVHIPKTGGTSLSLALEEHAQADDILIGGTPKARQRRARLEGLQVPGRLWKHSRLMDVAPLVPEHAFVLTLVRNPWDRLVSYYHWLQTQQFDHVAVRLAKTLTFGEFIASPVIQRSFQASPVSSYTTDAQGVDRCRLAARLEHLGEDLEPFWEHLGFRVRIPKVNASPRNKDWRGYYTDVEATLAGRLFAEDIARFSYRFDPD